MIIAKSNKDNQMLPASWIRSLLEAEQNHNDDVPEVEEPDRSPKFYIPLLPDKLG